MAASGYGLSHPTDRNDAIASLLIAYGQRGGALYAAYRLPDNPLVLSHVRWQGENGEMIEALHSAEGALEAPQAEREAWAQIALGSTSMQHDAFGPNAPWLPVSLDRNRAYELGMRVQEALRTQSQMYRPSSGSSHASSAQHHSAPMSPFGSAPFTASPYGGPSSASSAHTGGYERHTPDHRADEYPPTRLIDAMPSPSMSTPDMSQSTGQWARDDLMRGINFSAGSQPEVTVIACVEMEMPTLMAGATQDFTRDFARDVAIHFARAARSIPQARELRGWMRGARIVLGVRMGFGPGTRAPSRAEMEHGAALLADALARRTLPYVQLRFADLSEWSQGVELPNA
ncbi:MAG TPA: hypothetical protein VF792_03630 [Ktedonobacterales bacterium]